MVMLNKIATPPKKRPNLERQAIAFTVALYLFICAALLIIHYGAPEPPTEKDSGSSSTSPYNP
ncbi:hypothetical protein C9F11_45475 (plasmid) [Streptomyces sp. YIM 121038]|uniref:hypothetical protein n=1 Tax=Streptomyces sp. YIM 121038 TaxID=2136401 RepID=UPI001110B4B7|nr:hypothetical protein [Streptomyces sp. YIM 121038]QCX82655.1 hypothetical protein C9F11_45475 [Streptomyces sp. YIM 121038]